MQERQSFFAALSAADLEKIRQCAITRELNKDELVFAQGDVGDSFYIIEQGRVSVYYDNNGQKKILCTLGNGEYFGEMGILNQDRRSASVSTLEESTLLCLDKDNFIDMTRSNPDLAEKINAILTQRNEELILRESLCDAMGIRGENLYVSIKGDPSLRETALFRERYQSPVDLILDELQSKLRDIILNRCVFHLLINFNSGEIRARTIFDPYREKLHTADKLNDQAYIDRHFMETGFKEKLDHIKNVYQFISTSSLFKRLPDQWKSIFTKSRQHWQPLTREEVDNVISRLVELRNIPEFYLRNISINILQDAIRLQFNCDGTHIISTEEYQEFIKKNLTID
jgi:CRP-like cAMP-binding protein